MLLLQACLLQVLTLMLMASLMACCLSLLRMWQKMPDRADRQHAQHPMQHSPLLQQRLQLQLLLCLLPLLQHLVVVCLAWPVVLRQKQWHQHCLLWAAAALLLLLLWARLPQAYSSCKARQHWQDS
jgi:hypothetical protein